MLNQAQTEFEITPDIEASLGRNGGEYSSILTVRSESLDDEDIYAINHEGLWDLVSDSLTNRSQLLDLPEAAVTHSAGWTGWLWGELEGFAAWAGEMKALVPVTEDQDEDQDEDYQEDEATENDDQMEAEGFRYNESRGCSQS